MGSEGREVALGGRWGTPGTPPVPPAAAPMRGAPGEGSLGLGAVGPGQPRPLPRRAAGLSGSANGNECP